MPGTLGSTIAVACFQSLVNLQDPCSSRASADIDLDVLDLDVLDKSSCPRGFGRD